MPLFSLGFLEASGRERQGSGGGGSGTPPRSPAAHALGSRRARGMGREGLWSYFIKFLPVIRWMGEGKKEPQVWWWGDGLEAPFLALGGGGEEG